MFLVCRNGSYWMVGNRCVLCPRRIRLRIVDGMLEALNRSKRSRQSTLVSAVIDLEGPELTVIMESKMKPAAAACMVPAVW